MKVALDIRAAGLISPASGVLHSAAPEILAGTAYLERHPSFVGHDGLPQTGGFVAGCLEERDPIARLGYLLAAAYAGAMADLPEDMPRDERWHLFLALPAWLEHDAARLHQFKTLMPTMGLSRIGGLTYIFGGAVAGVKATDAAADALASGDVSVAMVAGVDSLVAPLVLDRRALAGLANVQTNPYGVVPGEAGALLVVQAADPDDRPFMARLHGTAIGTEQARLDDPERGIMGRAMTDCLTKASAGQATPGALLSDFNGERHRGEETGVVLTHLANDALADPICPATAIGDVGAATAPVYCALAPWAPTVGSLHLLAALGDRDGPRGALCIERRR
ncbi:hypothetical protein [Yoonia sp. SS1-5]|uniref:Beta-ketoacyl synthase N-terminal domain-containing protein n=1 Tax=Yoonia rhodophyticola TaxID=3137370 RepID=A0AAN0NKA5_9RHOB